MGAVYYVYDGKDRPVLSQDGEQRKTNAWSYTLYDRYNREVETGEVVLAGKTATQLRTEAGASRDYHPSGELTPWQYILYDSYASSSEVRPHAFVATPGFDSTFHPWVTGQLTATRTRILGSDVWQTSTQYYDSRGRIIQIVEDNRLGGLSRIDMLYDFTGNPVRLRESHGKADGSADVLESENSYDEQGRLLAQSITLNGGTAATLTYSYDALGRLSVKRYGSVDESLTYHVRGWLAGKESAPFRMRLRYERPEGGSAARWNGSLSEWEWQHGTSPAMQYGFSYDGLNRFTGAVQKQKSGTTWAVLSGDYVEKGLTYDRNGNLQSLQRTAGGKMVDNLGYTYRGNLLTGLSERVRTAALDDVYAPGASETGTYAYDLNGNLKKDSRRALLFDYNSLNLLSEVRRDGQPAAKYDWLADGTKLGVCDGSGTDGFEYVGSLIYRKSNSGLHLGEALFGDGVIRVNENGTQEVDYFLTDHLGSVRVIVDAAGAVKERNDYYPFGARHVRSDYALSTNRWKYNGKELQTTGNLGFLDYGARMYDMSVGRWFGMDPLAEEYTGLSGYAYAGNNPLSYIDVLGLYLGEPIYYGGVLDEAVVRPPRNTCNTSDVGSVFSFFRSSAGVWTREYNRRYNWDRMSDLGNLNLTLVNNYRNPFFPILHDLLDMGGMIPGIGEPLDMINAGVYLLEGDKLNFSLSLAAVIPVAGNFATGTRILGKLSNRELVYAAGLRAFKNIPGKGHAVGSMRHTYATNFLKHYQGIYGDRGLIMGKASRGRKAILDVIDINNNIIYDWKFGDAARMSRKQRQKYSDAFKGYEIDVLHYKY